MIFFSVLAIFAVIVFALLTSRRSGWRPRVVWVECFRVLLVSAAVWMLTQPETIYSVESNEKPALVLLADRSGSMQSMDVEASALSGTESSAASRQSMVDQLLQDERWGGLVERFQKRVEPFPLKQGSRSDLANAIEEASQKYPDAAALVLISDGDWNGSVSPIDAAADLQLRSGNRLAVYSVGVGSEQLMPDIEMTSAIIPSYATVGKPVRVPIVIRNAMPDTKALSVKLRVREVGSQKAGSQEVNSQVSDAESSAFRVVDEERITIRSGSRGSVMLQWLAEGIGATAVSVQVEEVAGESDFENNRVEKTIDVREEKLRVLIVESEPRWEFRYLRNALLRDPGIDVSCLLLQPRLANVGGGGDDYLKMFPDKIAELATYDVIFLGDVGVGTDGQLETENGKRGLSAQQCRQIAGLVREQAAGLVLMPGPSGRQLSLIESDLGSLFPVVLDASRRRGVGSATVGQFSLTSSGRTSLLTELEDDRALNWKRWASLPGFYWHAGVVRPRVGSEVLAVHGETSNEFGRLPLLVTRAAGAGKVLFMGTDSAWRWRRGVEDRYHYRFWGQVIRWMAYQRNMAAGQRLRLSYLPERPKPGDSVAFRLSMMTESGAPFDDESCGISLVAPDGRKSLVRLERTDAEWGVYAGATELTQSGEYKVVATHPTDGSEVAARLAVQGRAVEQVGRPARLDVMREIARVGGGVYFESGQLASLTENLKALPEQQGTLRRIQWWNHPGVTIALVTGLVFFWMGRKWAGMV